MMPHVIIMLVREKEENLAIISITQSRCELDKLIISQISTLKSHMPTPKRVTVIFIG